MTDAKAKIGINGFGRIGRLVLRAILSETYPNLEVVAINSRVADPQTAMHMFKYDSTYGTFDKDISYSNDSVTIDESHISLISYSSPDLIPWKKYNVDIVLECTGKFTDYNNANKHISNGAKKVIISAPGKEEDVTIVMGVNEDSYNPDIHHVISNASCTTNCLAPLVKVLNDSFGIVEGIVSTIHSYTNDQQILDKSHKDLRRARSAGVNIIPTSTGAAKAIGKVIPSLNGKIHGMAFRVPTSTVSLIDFVATIKSNADSKSINAVYQEASTSNMKNILDVSMEPLVSTDYKQSPYSCIVDGLSTMSLENNMIKVIAWYDNEWAYALRTVDLADHIYKYGL
jgi:glyceraldehyde 3-phosphate dehydrogenase